MLTPFLVHRLLPRLLLLSRTFCCALSGLFFFFLCFSLYGATADQAAFFEEYIRPLFHTHCSECHGEEKQESGLRIDHRASFFAGGESGPILSADKADESLLLEAIRYDNEDLQMPPEHPLPSEAVALLTRWVEMGAPWRVASARRRMEAIHNLLAQTSSRLCQDGAAQGKGIHMGAPMPL